MWYARRYLCMTHNGIFGMKMTEEKDDEDGPKEEKNCNKTVYRKFPILSFALFKIKNLY